MTKVRLTSTPPGVRLCPAVRLADGAARSFVLEIRGGRFHGFVVRRGGQAFGYVDRCPHAGLPLAQTLDAYVTPAGDLISCSWHGALFDVESGCCVGGPCAGMSLLPWAVAVKDSWIETVARSEGQEA